MAKSFKLRLYGMINSTFQSCRSKDRAALPHDPVPTPHICFSSVKSKFLPMEHSRRLSAAVDGGGRDSLEFKWQEDDKWHVVAKVHDDSQKPRRKIYNSSASGGDSGEDDISALPPPRIRRGRAKKTRTPIRHGRLSTSSADTESALFSHDDDEDEDKESLETETLISSSRSFSTDSSSEYIPQLETIREKPHHHHRRRRRGKKKAKSSVPSNPVLYRPSSVSEAESPARLSVFKKLIPCSVEGKVKESFAVVKKSEDPYEDFKRSMVEMILEKQMFEEKDLEQLLQCFLSLNCRGHHTLIVQAFVEIWEAMFCATDHTS